MSRKHLLNQVWIALSLGACLLTGPLAAGVCHSPSCEPYSPYYCSSDNSPCCYGSNEECSVCNGFIFGVEGLYWTVLENNLDYAVDFDPDNVDEILGGKTHFLDFDWRGGARGYAGFVWNNWDVRGVYTWYENDNNAHTDTTGSDIDLKASLLHPATDAEDAEIANAKSDLKYQTVDLILGREVAFCERSVVLHPFFGARALKLKQKFQVTYDDGDFAGEPARVLWDSDLDAAGLHAGMDMRYQWCGGFGLYGGFAGSILASKKNVHHRQETLDDDEVLVSTEIDLKEKQKVVIPGYQIAAGFNWEGWCGSCFYYSLKIGYEFNQWFDTPLLRRYHSGNEGVSNSATAGHIGFHGATLSLDFKF